MVLFWLLVSAGPVDAQTITNPNPIYPFGFESPLQIGDVYEGYEQPVETRRGIKLGPFSFTPGLQFNGTYTDNADLTYRNKRSDFIFSVSPTFTFTMSQDVKLKDYISFGYNGDLGAYMKTTQNSNTSHTLWADVSLMNKPTTYMRIRDSITYTDNPYGSQEYVGQGVTNRRVFNATDFLVGRKLPGKYSVELDFQNNWENYFDEFYKDWTSVTNTIAPSFLYELTGKTKLLAQYSIGYRSFYQQPSEFSSNYTSQTMMFGARWAATARLSGELKLGYGWRKFANKVDILGFPYQNESVPFYSANLRYLVSPKTDVNLTAYRQFLVGTDIFGSQIALFAEGITRNAFGLTVNTRLRKNFTVTVSGIYYLDQYTDTALYQGRTDKYTNMGIMFRHQFRPRLYWGLGYNYQKRDSPFQLTNSYTANLVTASVGVTY